jgi:hypothetical protein
VLPPWVYTFVAVGVTSVWLIANFVAILHGTTVDAQLHFLMGAVVGGTVGAQALERRSAAEKARRVESDLDGDAG